MLWRCWLRNNLGIRSVKRIFAPPVHQVWLGGWVVNEQDLRITGRGFESRPPSCRVQLWQVVYTLFSVTKQYNLVPANGRWCSAAGEVTVSLVESNGSLPPGLWLRSPAGWLPRTGISSRTIRSFRVWDYLYRQSSEVHWETFCEPILTWTDFWENSTLQSSFPRKYGSVGHIPYWYHKNNSQGDVQCRMFSSLGWSVLCSVWTEKLCCAMINNKLRCLCVRQMGMLMRMLCVFRVRK